MNFVAFRYLLTRFINRCHVSPIVIVSSVIIRYHDVSSFFCFIWSGVNMLNA